MNNYFGAIQQRQRSASFAFVLTFGILLSALLLSAPLNAESASIEPCEAPLVLHVRRPSSAELDGAVESFELCGASALTEFAPLPNSENEAETELFAQDMALKLTRTTLGIRAQLKLGSNVAEVLELHSNAPEQLLHWQQRSGAQPSKRQALPPTILMRAERRPRGSGLARQFKILKVKQPTDQIVRELVAVGKLDVTGTELLCTAPVTFNFEAITAGQLLGLAAEVCEVPMHTPADGRYLRFVRAKVYPADSAPPTFKDREAELKYSVFMAKRGNASFTAGEGLLELAELSSVRHDFSMARSYLAQVRALPPSWFGTTEISIDIAQARVEVQTGKRKAAERLLDKTLSALDQTDPNQISEERVDALLVRAELFAAEGAHSQAIAAARVAFDVNQQLPVWDGFRKRRHLLLDLLEDSEKQLKK